jgi:hypothetical protein
VGVDLEEALNCLAKFSESPVNWSQGKVHLQLISIFAPGVSRWIINEQIYFLQDMQKKGNKKILYFFPAESTVSMSAKGRFSSGCCRGDRQQVSLPSLKNPYKNIQNKE